MAWRFGGYRRTYARPGSMPVQFGTGKQALQFPGSVGGAYYGMGPGNVRMRGMWPRARRGMQPGVSRTGGFYGRYRTTNRYAQNGGRGAELKFHDVDIDDAVIASAGTIQTPGLASSASCNTIAQGTTEVTRIGRKCVIRSINWRFQISLPAGVSSGNTADHVRVILYLDKQCNGAAAVVTDILEAADFQAFNNLANKSRFRTLMDRRYDIAGPLSGDGTTLDSGFSQMTDSLYKKVNLGIEFDSTTGALTEIKSNNIGVLLISSGGIAGFASKMRLRFSDS